MNLDHLPVLQEIPKLGKGALAVERALVRLQSGNIDDWYVLGRVKKGTRGAEVSDVVVLARFDHTEKASDCILVNSNTLYTCPLDMITNYERNKLFKEPRKLDYFLPPAKK